MTRLMYTRHAVRKGVVIAALLTFAAGSACAARIKDLCEVQGARGNPLKGVGLVVGLSGTGDKNLDAARRQLQMLDRMNIEVEKLKDLGRTMQVASKCGLGQTSPNPFISILENFKDEIFNPREVNEAV